MSVSEWSVSECTQDTSVRRGYACVPTKNERGGEYFKIPIRIRAVYILIDPSAKSDRGP